MRTDKEKLNSAFAANLNKAVSQFRSKYPINSPEDTAHIAGIQDALARMGLGYTVGAAILPLLEFIPVRNSMAHGQLPEHEEAAYLQGYNEAVEFARKIKFDTTELNQEFDQLNK